jgi:predicted flap endonuclease-1-like 5' DNA nuclease
MAYLVQEMLGWLVLVAALAALCGWAFHVLRTSDGLEAKERERDQLRRDLVDMVNAELPKGDGELTQAFERDLDMLRTRADIQAARITELENQLMQARDQRDRDLGDIADLQRRLEHASAEPVRVQPLADDYDEEADRRRRWRLRYFEARAIHLEERLAAAAQPALSAPQEPDPFLVAERDAALAQAASHTARIAELEAALAAVPQTPAFDPQPLMDDNARLKDDHLRMGWHVRYLQARVNYLEDLEAKAPPLPAAPVGPSAEELEAERRGRWRTRYLEARIAHLEQGAGALQGLEADLAALRARIGELESSEATALELASQSDAKAAAEGQRAAALSQELGALRAQWAALEPQLAEARAAMATLPGLQARAVDLANQAAALRAERDRLAEELAALRRAPPPRDPEADELRWRARYLSSRVRHLESASIAPPAPPAPEPEDLRLVAPGAEVRPQGLGAPRMGAPDDLRLIDGIGPKLESTLNSLGIYHFDQIADWTPANIAWVDQYLRFRGRIVRERWVEQAKAIVAGASGRLTPADETV